MGNTNMKQQAPSSVSLPEEFYLNADGAFESGTGAGVTESGGWLSTLDVSSALDFKTPEINFWSSTDVGAGGTTPKTKTKTEAQTGSSLGSTLSGIGAVTGALATIYGIHEQKAYQDKVLGMEEKRIAKNEMLRDKQQAAYDAVWA